MRMSFESLTSSKEKKRKESPSSIAAFADNSPSDVKQISTKDNKSRGNYMPTSTRSQTKLDDAINTNSNSNNANNFAVSVPSQPLKKRKVQIGHPVIVYEFFGPKNPPLPKVLALECLDYLDNSDLFSVSLVNSLWNKAAMDEALWESSTPEE